MITQKMKYALKALLALADEAAKERPEPLTIEEIANRSGTPKRFLEHILLEVRNAGVIASIRGRSGGYSLIKKPAQISISELLRTIDGPIAPLPCLSRRAYQRCEDCVDEASCRIRKVDNAVSSMRAGLDAAQLQNVAILAYSINFGTSLAHAMLDGTDMAANSYAQTTASKIRVGNIDEAMRQTAIEIAQGADYIGVKPATVFMDAIARVKQEFRVPVATYIVSKEYCMVKAAAERGWVNERDTVMEYMLSMKRAGADKIFNYWVRDMLRWLKEFA